MMMMMMMMMMMTVERKEMNTLAEVMWLLSLHHCWGFCLFDDLWRVQCHRCNWPALCTPLSSLRGWSSSSSVNSSKRTGRSTRLDFCSVRHYRWVVCRFSPAHW